MDESMLWDVFFGVIVLLMIGIWTITAGKSKRIGGMLSIGLGVLLFLLAALVLAPAQQTIRTGLINGLAFFAIISGIRDILPEHLNQRYGRTLYIAGFILMLIVVAILFNLL